MEPDLNGTNSSDTILKQNKSTISKVKFSTLPLIRIKKESMLTQPTLNQRDANNNG